jgi:hypothetical protein
MPGRIREPWLSFLCDVDKVLTQPVEIHCLGGFVMSVLWDLPRPTGDVDFIDITPPGAVHDLLAIAGENSELARQYHLHFHMVTIAEYPEGYVSRLVDISPVNVKHICLRALEIHDLVLAKLSRNSPRDRADVEYLARKGALSRQILEERFDTELRPNLLNEERETTSMNLWLEEFFENGS